MKWYYPIALCIVALTALAFTGCNGPSPGLDPTMRLDFSEDVSWPYFPAGGELRITGEANAPESTDNPVVSAQWSEEPNVGGHFLVTAENASENIWRAPDGQLISEMTPVDLVLKMKTLLGGESTTRVHLIVVPTDNLPTFNFDRAAMTAANPTFPVVKAGQPIRILGQGELAGVPDPSIKYSWTALEGTNITDLDGFDVASSMNPIWTAPIILPNANNIPVSRQFKLRVLMTTAIGVRTYNTLVITVVP